MKFWAKGGAALVAGITGVTAAFFFDPRQGAKRRQKAGAAVQRQRASVSAMLGEAIDKAPDIRRRKAS